MARFRVLYPFRVVPAVAVATGSRVILDDTVAGDLPILAAARLRSAVAPIWEGRPNPLEGNGENLPALLPEEQPEGGEPVPPMTTEDAPVRPRRPR